jgi:hypothetical protein
MASRWTERQGNWYLHLHLHLPTFTTCDRASNALTALSPHAPGERSNGVNAAYVISKQSLYRPDLLLTLNTFSALRDSDLACCSMYPHMEENV